MTHDPLCPFAQWDDEHCFQRDAGVLLCDLIAKVREDERAKVQELQPCVRDHRRYQGRGPMTHDPLCRISKAIRDGECCADDPLFGYPCDCRLIAKVRQDMLAKCIDWMLDPHHHPSEEAAAWAYAYAEALRALEDKP